ncbi:MAG: hypothetical protein IAE93_12825 [Ignavibacteria bacterium]|nr:hypothetical protein [Ignavibacteria bacterium]
MQPATPNPKHPNTVGMQKLHNFQCSLTEPRFVEIFGANGQHLFHKYKTEYQENLVYLFGNLDDENKEILSCELQKNSISIT